MEQKTEYRMPWVELKYLLQQTCSKETSDAPDKWVSENPLFGHCAVIACIVQDFRGGRIRRALFPEEWTKQLGSRSHYWNEIILYNADGGEYFDLSKSQFPDSFPYADFIEGKLGQISEDKDWRDYVLSYPTTKNRYDVLRERVTGLLKSNLLFTDEKFQRAWELAFSGETNCPKMRFGCLVYDGDKLVTQSTNKNFVKNWGKERLCSFDGSNCVRIGIQSRADATLGDCGHAPIWCIKQIFDLGYKPKDLKKLDFYEGGFFPDGRPWWRDNPSYTCTYCENMFAIFGLDKIYGAFDGAWHPLWTKDSLYSATEYAKGLKKA